MGLFGFIPLPWEAITAKYGGFQTPVMRVTVNNSLFSLVLSLLGFSGSGSIRTDGVSITLNKDAASSATFRILDCYNSELRRFTSNISVGSKISIQLGYGSVLSTVFVGYVDTIGYDFDEHPSLKVTAFDGVKLMMDGGNQERHWKANGFYLQTITEILSRYADICTLSPMNIKPILKTHGHLVQKTNDYNFVKNVLCKYCGRDFVLVGGEGHLYDPMSLGSKLTTLGRGKGLLSFSAAPSYRKVKVCVTGYRLQNIKGESTVKTGDRYKTSMDREQTIVQENVPLLSASDCKEYATRLALDEVRKAQQASGVCVGLPELAPGRCIGVSGLDPNWNDKKYLISSVTHNLGTGGYTTSFQIEGWE